MLIMSLKSRQSYGVVWCVTLLMAFAAHAQPVKYGAEVLIEQHLGELAGKRVGLVANHTSRVYDRVSLLDSLRHRGVNVVRVFAPEHGFAGTLEGGVAVANSKPSMASGAVAAQGAAADAVGRTVPAPLEIVSLYGDTERPPASTLSDLDVVLFDIQDVGARFYTYLGTLTHVVQACAEAGTPLWVLDRPNPSGWAVDGPVLDTTADAKGKRLTGLTGLHPIPVQHGMTLGEYASLLCGERWTTRKPCQLRVIACTGYRHDMTWEQTGRPWVPPSPNLPSPQSARLYPYLCWFEGTSVSVGRGTPSPFEVTGLPKAMVERSGRTFRAIQRDSLLLEPTSFKPISLPGRAAKPLHENTTCIGYALRGSERDPASLWFTALLLLETYQQTYERVSKQPFYQAYFPKLAGQRSLSDRMLRGESIAGIYESWQPEIQRFRAIRQRYVRYP
jgi:uncharacterized protein YbbC (DUF1343 family)